MKEKIDYVIEPYWTLIESFFTKVLYCNMRYSFDYQDFWVKLSKFQFPLINDKGFFLSILKSKSIIYLFLIFYNIQTQTVKNLFQFNLPPAWAKN